MKPDSILKYLVITKSSETLPEQVADVVVMRAALPSLPPAANAILLDCVPYAQDYTPVEMLEQVRAMLPDTPLFLRCSHRMPYTTRQQYTVIDVFPPAASLSWCVESIHEQYYDVMTRLFLNRVAQHSAETLNPEDTLLYAMEQLQRVIPYDAVNITGFSNDSIIVKYRWGYEPFEEANIGNLEFSPSLPNFHKILSQKQGHLIADIEKDAGWTAFPETRFIRAWMGYPIIKNNVVIGILNFDSFSPNRFTPQHLDRLKPIMPVIVQQFEAAQLYQTLDEYSSLLSVINRQSTLLFTPLSTGGTLNQMCQHIVSTVVETFNKTDCGVMLLDETRRYLVRYGRAGDYVVRADGPISIEGQGLVPEAARTGREIYAPDVLVDDRYISNEPHTRSELVIPLKTARGVIGVLDLQSPQENAFSKREMEGLRAFAGNAALAIQNLQMYNRQRDYADELELEVNKRTAQLAASKERLEVILNHASEAIALLHTNGRIEQANTPFFTLTGLSEDAIPGIHLHNLVVPGFSQVMLQDTLTHVSQNKAPYSVNLQLQAELAQPIIDVKMDIQPIGIAHSQDQITMVCTIIDITRQKQQEASLRQIIETEREISQLKSRFIKTVEHQFRTPLTVILTSSELLQTYFNQYANDVPERTQTKITSHFYKIHHQIKLLGEMLTDVMFMSRASGEDMQVKGEMTDVVTLLNQVIRAMETELQEKQISIDITGQDPVAWVDPAIFSQIIQQTLSNAIKYSLNAPVIEVYLNLLPDTIELKIQDYGIGISEADLKRIFDPFFRGDTVDTIQGTGLGLAILKHGANLHGGHVQVESKLNHGTCFTVRLPRVPTE